jgi:hypothetical protein
MTKSVDIGAFTKSTIHIGYPATSCTSLTLTMRLLGPSESRFPVRGQATVCSSMRNARH